MLRKLIVLLLVLPAVPAALLIVKACQAESPKAATAAKLTAGAPRKPPGYGPVLVPVRVPRTEGVATPKPGDRLDVCFARGTLMRRLPVKQVFCRSRQFQCAAWVEVPEERSLLALGAYDLERPPIAMTPGAAC